jgi:hypothetical protein
MKLSPLSLVLPTILCSLALGCGGDPKPGAAAPEGAKSDAAEKPASADAAPAGGGVAKVAADHEAAASADGGGEKVKVVEGARASGDDRYDLLIEPPADAKAGEAGQVTLKVVPKKPWHMNLDFPTSLKMDTPEGVALAKASQKKADAVKLDDEHCEFAVEFTPAAAGEQTFTGKFKFAVCQDEACAPVTEDVEFRVAVK